MLNKPGILTKLALSQAGLYLIKKIHDNGNGTCIVVAKNMAVTKRANIRYCSLIIMKSPNKQ